jgi:hypothetical protein
VIGKHLFLSKTVDGHIRVDSHADEDTIDHYVERIEMGGSELLQKDVSKYILGKPVYQHQGQTHRPTIHHSCFNRGYHVGVVGLLLQIFSWQPVDPFALHLVVGERGGYMGKIRVYEAELLC